MCYIELIVLKVLHSTYITIEDMWAFGHTECYK